MMKNMDKALLKDAMLELLNRQIVMEHQASLTYLGMATWADVKGYPGVASFLYAQSKEEREHMCKLVHYLTQLEIVPKIPYAVAGDDFPSYNSLQHLFQEALAHEMAITKSIHQIVKKCLQEEDFATFEFLQWFVQEQREEEATIRDILSLFERIKESPIGEYTIDKAIENMQHKSTIE